MDLTRLYANNGQFLINMIFWERSSPEKRLDYPPVYTLKQEEFKGLPSMYKVYMDSTDEYEAAIKLVGNMKNWGKLVNSNWFMKGDPIHGHEGLTVWREHMRMRDASSAKRELHKKMKDGDTTAAKAVLAETKVKASVGRKNKKNAESTEDKNKKAQMKEWRAKQEAAKKRANK